MTTAEMFAADIDRYRDEAVADATRAAEARHLPADVVKAEELRAGESWDRAHPLVASGLAGGRL